MLDKRGRVCEPEAARSRWVFAGKCQNRAFIESSPVKPFFGGTTWTAAAA